MYISNSVWFQVILARLTNKALATVSWTVLGFSAASWAAQSLKGLSSPRWQKKQSFQPCRRPLSQWLPFERSSHPPNIEQTPCGGHSVDTTWNLLVAYDPYPVHWWHPKCISFFPHLALSSIFWSSSLARPGTMSTGGYRCRKGTGLGTEGPTRASSGGHDSVLHTGECSHIISKICCVCWWSGGFTAAIMNTLLERNWNSKSLPRLQDMLNARKTKEDPL